MIGIRSPKCLSSPTCRFSVSFSPTIGCRVILHLRGPCRHNTSQSYHQLRQACLLVVPQLKIRYHLLDLSSTRATLPNPLGFGPWNDIIMVYCIALPLLLVLVKGFHRFGFVGEEMGKRGGRSPSLPLYVSLSVYRPSRSLVCIFIMSMFKEIMHSPPIVIKYRLDSRIS